MTNCCLVWKLLTDRGSFELILGFELCINFHQPTFSPLSFLGGGRAVKEDHIELCWFHACWLYLCWVSLANKYKLDNEHMLRSKPIYFCLAQKGHCTC